MVGLMYPGVSIPVSSLIPMPLEDVLSFSWRIDPNIFNDLSLIRSRFMPKKSLISVTVVSWDITFSIGN